MHMQKIFTLFIVLLAGLFNQVQAQYFVMTDSLPAPHLNQQAQALSNGKVLCFGGENGAIGDPNGTYNTAYLYSNGVWTPTGSMHVPRTQFASVVLQSGKVMAIGGITSDLSFEFASCEIYDPATGQWTYTDSMPNPTYIDGTVVLNNGNVLVADGDSSHIYNPTTGHWSAGVAMAAPHGVGPLAVLLQNGNVLAVGGADNNTVADVYNPTSNTWTATGSTTYSRYLSFGILLNDGKALVYGSAAIDSGQNTSELYDPATGRFTVTGNLLTNVASSPAVLLNNGNPIVWSLGNEFGTPPALQTIQVYNVASGTWFAPPASQLGTSNGSLVKMGNNQILAIAGQQLSAALPYCWLINGNNLTSVNNVPEVSFNLYPNPGHNAFTLGTASLPEASLLSISDATGRMVLQTTVSAANTLVNAEGLEAGCYLLVLSDNHGNRLGTTRWVKM